MTDLSATGSALQTAGPGLYR